MAEATEALVMGRVGADLYPGPDQVRKPLSRIGRFDRYVGGFAGNVATGLARLGVRVAIASRIGDDGHGEFIREFLASEGVDVTRLGVDPELRTALAFCEVWPPDRFPITFYRTPTCPDWRLSRDDVDPEGVADVPLLYATGTGLARSPSRETTLDVIATHRGRTIVDLDHRSSLWEDPDDYGLYVMLACRSADVVIGNTEELAVATGHAEETEAATALLALGASLVLAKRGSKGCAVYEPGSFVEVPGVEVEVVNALGAGDAFAAAVGYGLLRGLTIGCVARLANAAGALVATEMPCSAAMPSRERLESFAQGEEAGA